MTPEQLLALLNKVPEPVWHLVSDTIAAIVRGDSKTAAIHAQAAGARQAAHLALHAKESE